MNRILVVLCLVSAFATRLFSAAASAPVAFVDVTVLPMDSDRVLRGHTVVVSGDRITHVGPTASVAIPAGATRVPGAGRFLLPGFGEMHGHNPAPGSTPEFVEAVYFLYVANGVTTVRSMLGWPGQLEYRERVRKGDLIGPTLHLAGGPSFSGTGANAVTTPAAAEARVRQQKGEGWDLLKVHPGLTRAVYDAMARTADEVGIRFAGHVPADVGIVHAIARRQQTIDHLDGYIEFLGAQKGPIDPAKLAEIVKLTRDSRTAVVPTMALWETILGAASLEQLKAYPELKYLPAAMVEGWKTTYENRLKAPNYNATEARQIAANRKVLLKALSDGGVDILFGTDAPQIFSVPGFSIHRELQAMAAAGMKPYDILRSATKNVGDHLKASDAFGTIAVGQRADLILLQANPLEDVGNVARRAGVMVRGMWLAEADIQARLAKIARE